MLLIPATLFKQRDKIIVLIKKESIVEKKRIFILTKTYPSPSSKHIETACVAGIDRAGKMIRLYPVPFRLMDEEQKFKKWQWIEALVQRNPQDNRHESFKILVDKNSPTLLETVQDWGKRAEILQNAPTFTSFAALEEERLRSNLSLAVLKPKRIESLEITVEKNSEWSEEEIAKLHAEMQQPDLFQTRQAVSNIPLLKKMPHHFYYHYICDENGAEVKRKHKIIDWEAGALYWKMVREHGDDWEAKFRAKYEDDFIHQRDIWFLMGNMHRFRNQWLIISVIYPPKQTPEQAANLPLFG